VLEEMIRQRLKPSRPVEVINAGICGLDLEQNLLRLRKNILPLQPDMIISYHGCFNGLHLLKDQWQDVYSQAPQYHRRPLKILGDVEYRINAIAFRREEIDRLKRYPPNFDNPMATRYCQAYQHLIQIVQTNHIRLALANYSMAINSQSDPDVIQFYRLMDAQVDWLIAANVVHSTIVSELTRQHPDVLFVDTHPHLDGEHDKFIDFIHFDAEGDRQLAENIFAGIANCVANDLGVKTANEITPPTNPDKKQTP